MQVDQDYTIPQAGWKETVLHRSQILAMVFLFAGILLVFLSTDLWDFDFWWHAATGRYIVTEGKLPDRDPFSFTSELEENRNPLPERENFLLKSYWVSQVLFYFIFNTAGPRGIIWMRSLILVLTAFMVYRRLRDDGVSYPICFLSCFLLYFILTQTTGERPVLFTIFFTALTLYLLEDYRYRRGRKIFLLIPLMLLWANMHGGFIIGVAMLLLFAVSEMLNTIFGKSGLTGGERRLFYAVIFIAIANSYLNPTGWDAFLIAFSARDSIVFRDVQEFQSPLFLYLHHVRPLGFHYVILALMFPLIVLFRNKRMQLHQLILLAPFYYMAMTVERYGVYYAITGIMTLGKEVDCLADEVFKKRLTNSAVRKIELVFTAAIFLSGLLFLSGQVKPSVLNSDIAKHTTVPVDTVNFIEKQKPDGNILNEYIHGGYLSWKLYPWKKNFTDTRVLNSTVATEYEWIYNAFESMPGPAHGQTSGPLWAESLKKYNINIVLMPVLDIYGQLPPIVMKLLESEEWAPVHIDPLSILFLRSSAKNRPIALRYGLKKEDVYSIMIRQCLLASYANSINPRPLISLAELFFRTGRFDDSLNALKLALKRDPLNKSIRSRIEEMETRVHNRT